MRLDPNVYGTNVSQENAHRNLPVTFRNVILCVKAKMHLSSGTQGKRGDNGAQTPLTIAVKLRHLFRYPISRVKWMLKLCHLPPFSAFPYRPRSGLR